uniref:Transcription factor bHLH3-delta n=1 Tax=Rhizophora mucronata TaxID=61149 RepID=A0A2P2M9P0_RHIMU
MHTTVCIRALLARMALENVLLSTSFAPASHTCCRLAYAFPGNPTPGGKEKDTHMR